MDLYHRLFLDSLGNAIRLEKNYVLSESEEVPQPPKSLTGIVWVQTNIFCEKFQNGAILGFNDAASQLSSFLEPNLLKWKIRVVKT